MSQAAFAMMREDEEARKRFMNRYFVWRALAVGAVLGIVVGVYAVMG